MAKEKASGSSILSMQLGKNRRVTKYPDKTSINLVRNQNEKRNLTDILVIILILVCLVAFAKFAVLDQLDELTRAQRQYGIVQDQLTSIRTANARYNDVKERYDLVTEWYLTDEEKAIIDKTGVFQMLEQDLMPYVQILRVQVKGNTVSVETGETTLDDVSKFLLILQADPRNLTATVTTTAAASKSSDEERVKASVVIQYTGDTGEEEEEASPAISKEELARRLLGDDADLVLGGN